MKYTKRTSLARLALTVVVCALAAALALPAPALGAGEKLSLGLEEAVEYALAHSPQVRMADYGWDCARYAAWQAEAAWDAAVYGGKPDPTTVQPPFQAQASADIANRARTAVRETLSAAVRQAYFLCLQAELAVEVARAAHDLAVRQEDAAELLAQYGMAAQKDVLAARAKAQQAQAALASAESGAAAARYALCVLLGVPPETELELTEREFAYEPVVLSAEELDAAADRAARERYEAYAAETRLDAREQEVDFVVYANINGIPLPFWADVMAEAAKALAEAELEQARLGVRQEVYRAYGELLAAQAAYEASAAAVAGAEEGLRAAREKFRYGAATDLEVRAAEFALLQAQAERQRLLYAWYAAKEKYQHSKGKGMSLAQSGGAGAQSAGAQLGGVAASSTGTGGEQGW